MSDKYTPKCPECGAAPFALSSSFNYICSGDGHKWKDGEAVVRERTALERELAAEKKTHAATKRGKQDHLDAYRVVCKQRDDDHDRALAAEREAKEELRLRLEWTSTAAKALKEKEQAERRAQDAERHLQNEKRRGDDMWEAQCAEIARLKAEVERWKMSVSADAVTELERFWDETDAMNAALFEAGMGQGEEGVHNALAALKASAPVAVRECEDCGLVNCQCPDTNGPDWGVPH